ncbi:MAG: coenzyme Q-binding protein COQ10 [Kiritimatiellia bacterium]|jgi:coenzyme Q-binding protein COQ10
MAAATRTVDINVPIDALFAVITDYDRYPDFLDDIEAVNVLQRGDGFAVVEFTLKLIKRVRYTLRMNESAPSKLAWTLEKSKVMKANVGGWELEERENGTRATYTVDVTPRGFVPGSIVKSLTGRTLPATLEAFKKRAESLA